MTNVYFVRHAQPDHTKTDRIRPLSKEGVQDSKIVLDFFRTMNVDAFYCSPYIRSVDTIKETAQYFNKEIILDERLRERESGPNGNNYEMFHKRWSDHEYHEEGGESLHMVQARNCEALDSILEANEGKIIVIGTHGTALSTILNYYNKDFGCEDFLRIIDWMPYIIELDFEGKNLVAVKEHTYLVKKFEGKCSQDTDQYLNEALEQYKMPGAKAELIRHNENMTYQVNEQYLLRIHKHAKGFTTDPIYDGLERSKLYQEELSFVSYLKKMGMNVQTPVQNQTGTYVTKLSDGTLASMLTWLPGHIISKDSVCPELCYQIGEMTGKLHDLSQCFPKVQVLNYDDALCARLKDKLERLTKAGLFDGERAQIMSDALDVIADRLRKVKHEEILTHSDLSLSNMLVTENGIAPIDFSLFGYCHPMMDIAALYCTVNGVENRKAIAEGYESMGNKIDFPILDCCFALNILLGIILHSESWTKQDWFDERLTRWCNETFGPLAKGGRIISDDYYMLNVNNQTKVSTTR